jgi:diguanylate cyclase (GGDEF)-like protein
MYERLGLEVGVAPARLAGVEPELLAAIGRRIAELKDEAALDELTGALRRAAGLDALQREVRRARRFDDRKLTVVFADLDDLKLINDSQGHAAGDDALREMAGALRHRLRAYDLVIRWGGDEFVCSLPGAGVAAAERAMDDALDELVARAGCTFSAGYAELGEDGEAVALVARADADYYARRTTLPRGGGTLVSTKRHGLAAHSPAYSTPTRGVRTMLSGSARKPSSTM